MDRTLWKKYRGMREGAPRARLRAELLADNDGLARSYAQSYMRATAYYTEHLDEDLLQAARLGLLRALDDPRVKVTGSFSYCAWVWSRHEMQQVTRHATRISVPRSAFMPQAKQDEWAKFEALNGRAPTPEEIGLTEGAVERARKAEPIIVDVREADDLPDTMPDMEGDIDRKRDTGALQEFVSRLSKRDAKEFWTGTRADLTERAKRYVEGRRAGQPAAGFDRVREKKERG